MAKLTLDDVSKKMREIDICMMTTKAPSGQLESRPMSNNREVDYKGDSYFFSNDDCSAVREIKEDKQVNLSLTHKPLLGAPFYLSVVGSADIIQDKVIMKAHWVKDLDKWFPQGVDTPGVTLIHVKASRLKYWDGMDEGEIEV